MWDLRRGLIHAGSLVVDDIVLLAMLRKLVPETEE
jgi:hypothetical protein